MEFANPKEKDIDNRHRGSDINPIFGFEDVLPIGDDVGEMECNEDSKDDEFRKHDDESSDPHAVDRLRHGGF